MEPSLIAPPPWTLTGNGVVVLYHIPASFNRHYGFMSGYQQRGYIGAVGAVVLADYETSEVGPYRELLYIPGMVRVGGKLTFSISKIYVSTYDSLWNGRRNWGIPKELADFKRSELPDGTQVYKVGISRRQFFEAHVKPWSPRLPFSNRLLPYTHVTQQLSNTLLRTKPVACGHAQLASLTEMAADPLFFPPLHHLTPLFALALPDFRMTFPLPIML